MRILYLTNENPFELDNSSKTKDYNTILTLSKEHELLVLTYCDKGFDKSKLNEFKEKGLEVKFVDSKHKKSNQKSPHMGIFFKNRKYVPELDNSEEMRSSFKDALKTFSPNIVHVSSFSMTGYVELSKVSYGVVYDVSDVNFFRFNDKIDTGNYLSRWIVKDYAARILNHEAKVILNSKAVFMTSESIRSSTHSCFQNINPVYVVPLGVDIERIGYAKRDFSNKDVVLMNNWDTEENRYTFNYYARKIHPKLLKIHPDYKLLLIGSGCEKCAKDFKGSNVEFLGHLDDEKLIPVINKSSCMVVPVYKSQHNYTKIINAFAAGIPVVSTEHVINSIDVTDDTHLLIADNSDDFVSQINFLFNDKELASKISVNARTLVEENYAVDKVSEKILSYYKKIETRLSESYA